MFDLVPLMCAAGLSVLYSGKITSTDQYQVGHLQAFSQEVPNNGFILQPQPEIWGMGIKIENDAITSSGGGLLWLQQNGPLLWRKGQTIKVRITACEDDSMQSALVTWNALVPTQ